MMKRAGCTDIYLLLVMCDSALLLQSQSYTRKRVDDNTRAQWRYIRFGVEFDFCFAPSTSRKYFINVNLNYEISKKNKVCNFLNSFAPQCQAMGNRKRDTSFPLFPQILSFPLFFLRTKAYLALLINLHVSAKNIK